MVGLIGVLRRVIARGIVQGWSGEAYRYVVVTVFDTGAVIACLPTLVPVCVADEFRSLRGRFCRSGRVLIRFSSKSNDRQ